MHRPIALFLCIVAQGAFAQCVAPATTVNSHPATHAPVHATAMPTQGIIKTAAAGTPDDAPPIASQSMRESPRDANGQDRPRRGGTAMVLTALALMSGIALRRYGAGNS